MNYRGQDKTFHERHKPTVGVLLTNLGTPAAPTAEALRPYLKEFLSDPRVIELPKWKWWPILHGIILRVRPKKSAKLYASVWTEQGSPLMSISLEQTAKLNAYFERKYPGKVRVKLGMRYGEPAIGKVLREFQDEGINRIIVLPLYPQYSGPTVGSTFDAVAQELIHWRWTPELHFINTYHDHPLYIEALANSVKAHIAEHGEPEKLILSYHGMPQRYFDGGDPYYCYCQKTSRLVAEKLGWDKDRYITSFQSQFGKEEWIKPDTSTTLQQLAQNGIKKVAVICPGFSADCLETLEEIGVENKKLFLSAGGESYHYIPALNAGEEHIGVMGTLVGKYL
ncbi:ferrochelatase [Saccharophagus sp. K07]|uniref:ferrochelatase n=1 Tax=Saccharophagus sp. K07 TaxID=2283636 RepID=UPI0016527634|nr:ferrochelatase [Saccharophagus sp. K07]MBC6906333.1 ferrochelatase [Saccharophagus sp. K07]